jgi:hypothetical protein
LVSFVFVDGDRQSTLFQQIGKKEKKRKGHWMFRHSCFFFS